MAKRKNSSVRIVGYVNMYGEAVRFNERAMKNRTQREMSNAVEWSRQIEQEWDSFLEEYAPEILAKHREGK